MQTEAKSPYGSLLRVQIIPAIVTFSQGFQYSPLLVIFGQNQRTVFLFDMIRSYEEWGP